MTSNDNTTNNNNNDNNDETDNTSNMNIHMINNNNNSNSNHKMDPLARHVVGGPRAGEAGGDPVLHYNVL